MSLNEAKARHSAHSRVLAAVIAVIVACACVAVAGILSPQQAYAEQDATLTVVVKHGSTNIDGMKLEAYEVARIGAAGSYEATDAYKSAGIDFNASMTAAQSIAAANKLSSTAKGQKPAATATTDKDGKASFGKLDNGIYLITQSGATGTASKYSTLSPWLVNVPQVTDDEIVYDVVSQPKPQLKPVTPSKTVTPASRRAVKTGDTTDWRLIAVCACVGLVAMGGAIAAARRRQRN